MSIFPDLRLVVEYRIGRRGIIRMEDYSNVVENEMMRSNEYVTFIATTFHRIYQNQTTMGARQQCCQGDNGKRQD